MLPTEIYMAVFAAFILFDSTRVPALACLLVSITGYQFESLPDYAYEGYYTSCQWASLLAGVMLVRQYPLMSFTLLGASVNEYIGLNTYLTYGEPFGYNLRGFFAILVQILLLWSSGRGEIRDNLVGVVRKRLHL
jgi:hypothetical protein